MNFKFQISVFFCDPSFTSFSFSWGILQSESFTNSSPHRLLFLSPTDCFFSPTDFTDLHRYFLSFKSHRFHRFTQILFIF